MILAIVAQVLQDNQTVLLTYGPLGIICAYFMYQTKDLPKDIRGLAHRIDGLTKALLADMVDRDSCGVNAKRFAREEIAKIEAREERK